MNCRFTDLRHKEVISACDGTRIGLWIPNAQLLCQLLFSADRDFLVWWENVRTT